MSLLELLITFLFYTIITFGNGPVMFPLLEQTLVQQYHLISQEQMLYSFAIARITPGQANVYISAVGFLSFGFIGAILSSFAIIIPSYLMIPLMHGYERVKSIAWVNKFVKGITVTSIGLIFSSSAQIGHDVLASHLAWMVFCLVLLLSWIFKINGFANLVIASCIGIALKLLM